MNQLLNNWETLLTLLDTWVYCSIVNGNELWQFLNSSYVHVYTERKTCQPKVPFNNTWFWNFDYLINEKNFSNYNTDGNKRLNDSLAGLCLHWRYSSFTLVCNAMFYHNTFCTFYTVFLIFNTTEWKLFFYTFWKIWNVFLVIKEAESQF